tara:strand:+ start:3941 stop:4108 length:168 start_codon:yes stop_codon:yes gene_type:complete
MKKKLNNIYIKEFVDLARFLLDSTAHVHRGNVYDTLFVVQERVNNMKRKFTSPRY